MKSSVEKRGRSERNENITQIEKSYAKKEYKSIVRISERREKKVVWSRAERSV